MLATLQTLTTMPRTATSGQPLAGSGKVDFGSLEHDLTSFGRRDDLGVLDPKLLNGAMAGIGAATASAAGSAVAGSLVGGAVGAMLGGISALGTLGLPGRPVAAGESAEMRRMKQFARSLNGGGGSTPIAEHEGYIIVGGARVRRRAPIPA